MVPRDDLMLVGSAKHLTSIAMHMGSTFMVKVSVTGQHGCNHLGVFDRGIKRAPHGVVYETDLRRADKLIGEAGLTTRHTLLTPAVLDSKKERTKVKPRTPMGTRPRPVLGNLVRIRRTNPRAGDGQRSVGRGGAPRDATETRCRANLPTKFRAMVARCSLLGSDRWDLQSSAKEAQRSIATPHVGDRERVVRIAQYLNGEYHRRVQQTLFRLG